MRTVHRHAALAAILASFAGAGACSDGTSSNSTANAGTSGMSSEASGASGGHTTAGNQATAGTNAEAGADTTNIEIGNLGEGGSPSGGAGASSIEGGKPAAGEPAVGGSTVGGRGDAGAGGDTPTCGTPTVAPKLGAIGSSGLLLRGTVVTPSGVIAEGEVLVQGDTIACASASCAASPGYADATVVETGGTIFPGLIDTHNHVLFDTFDETDWTPQQAYKNHNQWTNEAKYGALVDAKQYLNGESGSPINLGCELDKYGELKGLIAGTTSIVGAANPTNRTCFGTLARTIDQSPNGLGVDKVQVATLFPDTTAANNVCGNFADTSTAAYLIHIAEGVDDTAKAEFAKLGAITTMPAGCLYAPQTAIVHGTALGDAEFSTMAQHQMSLVWSPRSNVSLYGGGTDLTKTTNIPLAFSKGINVALAPDWSISGSQNLLDELRYANMVDDTQWNDVLSPEQLAAMVTTHAARVLGLQNTLGAIEVGEKADLVVIGGDRCAPYDSLLASRPADIRLVMVGGVALYGDKALEALGPSDPGCENLDVCGASKFVCVAAPSKSATDKFGQTFAEIKTALADALAAYDAQDLSAWDFAPIAPLVSCP